MANQSLTDLTARTSTADTDLIHVNSGGTDYKQAKSDFTKDIVTKITFNNTSLLTSQVEALPNQNYTGYISSAGHVTQTGVPEDTYYWVFVYKLSANNIRIEIRELAPAGHSYHNTKTTQGWSGWILDPTREEITSLNSSLANTSLKYSDHTYTGTFTPNSSGYVKLGSIPTDFGVSINNYFVGFLIRGWSGGQGALTLAIGSNGTDLYLLSSSTTSVTSINIRMWYVPTAST